MKESRSTQPGLYLYSIMVPYQLDGFLPKLMLLEEQGEKNVTPKSCESNVLGKFRQKLFHREMCSFSHNINYSEDLRQVYSQHHFEVVLKAKMASPKTAAKALNFIPGFLMKPNHVPLTGCLLLDGRD